MVSQNKTNEATPGFTGREELIEQVSEEIEKGEVVIVLHGAPGTGKSAVLERIERIFKKQDYHTILFHGKVSPEIVLEQLAMLATSLGIKETENIYFEPVAYKDKLEKLLEHFVYKFKVLFLFEDFHKNLDDDGKITNERLNELIYFLSDILKDKESAVVLCTTRELNKLESIKVEPLSWSDFSRLVAKTNWLSGLNKKSLKSMHFEMGGFPRAILLLDQIAGLEFKKKPFQWPELRECIPGLTRSIMHKESETADFSYLLIDWLLEKLNENESEILKTFAVYRDWIPGTATHAAGVEIKPSARRRLERLIQITFSSLAGKTGYRVPGLVARTVCAQMDETQLKERHLKAAAFLEGLTGESHYTWNENRLESIWHLLEAGDCNNAAQAIFAADEYFCKLGFPQLALDLLMELEEYLPQLEQQKMFHLRTRLGVMYAVFGKMEEAAAHHQYLFEVYEEMGEKAAASLHIGQVGMLHETKGKYDEALEALRKSKEILLELDTTDYIQLALRYRQIGSISKRQGKYEDAYNHYIKALELARKDGTGKEVAHDLEQLGRIFDEQAKFDDALNYYQQSIELKKQLEDKTGVASLTHQMGNVYFVKGQLTEAEQYYREALAMNEEMEDSKSMGYSRGQIGLILQRNGKLEEAMKFFNQSLEDFEKADEKKGLAAGHHQLGRIFQGNGEKDIALAHYQKAMELREETGDMLGAAITYGQLGLLNFEKEEFETSLRYSVQAYAIFSRYGSPNVQLARQNMIRLKSKLSEEVFNQILEEYHIKTEKEAE